MTRFEFMTKLQGLLQEIPLEERNAALNYYEDYFEDAGIENVDKIIAELVSPERVAAIIKSDLSDNPDKDYNKLEYTENGCHDRNIETDRFEVINSTINKETQEGEKEEKQYNEFDFGGYNSSQDSHYSSHNAEKSSTYEEEVKRNPYRNRKSENSSKTLLIILLCIFGIPVILPVVAGIGSGLLGVVGGLLGVFAAIGISTIACFIAGGASLIVGFISLFQTPVNSMFLCGAGLLSLGIGMLLMMLAVFIWSKLIPGLLKGIIYLCKLPFKKRRENV